MPKDCKIDIYKIKINRCSSVNKTRPVKIDFLTREAAVMVMRAKPKVDTVRFKPDLTIAQRNRIKTVRQEIEKREQDGEISLVLKYRFGKLYITRQVFRRPHTIKNGKDRI